MSQLSLMPPVREARQETTTSYLVSSKALARMESQSPTEPNLTDASGNKDLAPLASVLPPMPDLSRTNAVTS